MKLRFTDLIERGDAEALDAVGRAQLQEAGKRYDGDELPAADRLGADGEDELEGQLYRCTFWTVMGDGVPRFDAWFYMGDSGTIFATGTTEVVAEIIQFGLECSDPALRLALGAAMVEAKLLPIADSHHAEFAAALAAQTAR